MVSYTSGVDKEQIEQTLWRILKYYVTIESVVQPRNHRTNNEDCDTAMIEAMEEAAHVRRVTELEKSEAVYCAECHKRGITNET